MTEETTAATVLAGVDLSGRTIAVTGATSGMGAASAHALAAAGARVLLMGRKPDAVAQTAASVAEVATDRAPQGIVLDLASLSSVRAAADQVADTAPQLDVLMNNAGVMFTPFGRTADGFETQVGVCHLGHFALTEALMPSLRAAAAVRGEARVVVLSSAGHTMGDVDLDDLNWEAREYDKFHAYGAAKTANALHAVGFGAAHPDSGVTALSVHPGIVGTNLARHMTREDFSTMFNYGDYRKGGAQDPERPKQRQRVATPEQGAATQVWASVTAELRSAPGAYLADCAVSHAAPYAVDPERAARLFELSARLTG